MTPRTRRLPAEAAELAQRIELTPPRDRRRLRRRLDDAARGRGSLDEVTAALTRVEARLAGRRAAVPALRYPEELPVSQKREEILAAIRDHQVVVVAGETGSGKTTQIPKICLELGRGITGMIGHTQPRRIAARSVAERIAEELGTQIGEGVGYAVRFTDRVGENSLVKLMTDGILLAEIQHDRELERYDTLIIDEAHERSLNIDFILGYLKRLLPRRPDLKVIITSATIDPYRFAAHFGDAPVVEVSGRTYPVEVRYRPVVDPDDPSTLDRDQTQAVCDAVIELFTERDGDILVFLSGEREIRDTADALRRLELRHTEILPLYARLSAADQHRVFSAHTGRRVVLATNVAETSLTVPGIRFVVDSGTARISRYSHRTKVQRLPIEPISQASARQRAGRCGRVADGVCIRLYGEEDFEHRPAFTDPEILRTNLASVILQMTALGLGEVADFGFVDPPDPRSVKDGVHLLEELGAFAPRAGAPAAEDPRDGTDGPNGSDRTGGSGDRDSRGGSGSGDTDGTSDGSAAAHRQGRGRRPTGGGGPGQRLTEIGRRLSQLPIDPRLARMVLEADRLGCLREVLVITSALSIQDPRERPTEAQTQASQLHARFVDPDSDFLTLVNLWNHLQDRQRELSSSQFRKLCRAEFLHYLRVREWQDLHSQLRRITKGLGMERNPEPAPADRVHQALLTGLLSQVGLKDAAAPDYLGARGARFAINPGSALARKSPTWVMAAELVETSRLWARTVSRVDPAWVEELGQHLVRRSYSEPHWEKKRAAVMASERVTLYGIPLVPARTVTYSAVDPALCRELFLRHALVEGDWSTHHKFFHANRALLKELEALEHRARRRGLLVDDEVLLDFYDARVPADVVSGRHFDAWWKKASRAHPGLLDFTEELLLTTEAEGVGPEDYPDEVRWGEFAVPLRYQFEPGTQDDGVTARIPLPVLNQVDDASLGWLVPGLREELLTALIRTLPKAIRTRFVPAPDHARAALEHLSPQDGPLLESLSRYLSRVGQVEIPVSAWDLNRLPDHLRMTFEVVDERDRSLGRSKDLDELRARLRGHLRQALAQAGSALERTGATRWDFGTLPRTFERARAGTTVRGYPALVDEGTTVGVRILPTATEQERAMLTGTRRLLLLGLTVPVRGVLRALPQEAKLALSRSPHPSPSALFDDATAAAVDALVTAHGGPAWDAEAFARLSRAVGEDLPGSLLHVLRDVADVLALAHTVEARMTATNSLVLVPALADLREQLNALVYPGFVAGAGLRRLPDLVRYLRAMSQRLDKLAERPARDRDLMARVHAVRQDCDEALVTGGPGVRASAAAAELPWMVEELRVSLFAQTVGTAYPISEQRIRKALAALG